MRQTKFTDSDGRMWARLIPDNAPESHAEMGVPLGPPSLVSLGYPSEVEIRLHNQLYQRGILVARDAADVMKIQAAVMAALKIDALAIQQLYLSPVIDTPSNGVVSSAQRTGARPTGKVVT